MRGRLIEAALVEKAEKGWVGLRALMSGVVNEDSRWVGRSAQARCGCTRVR